MESFFVALERRKEKKKVRLKEGTFWLVGKVTRLERGCEALTVHHSCVGEGKIGKITPFLQVSAGSLFFFTLRGAIKVLSLVFFLFFLLK